MDKYVAVWRDGTRVCTSRAYDDEKQAVKYACQRIIEGHDAVVLPEAEHIKLIGGIE